MSVCLTAAGITVALALEQFTLAWTHSAERTLWREVWRVTEQGLVLDEAVVQGSGAGIDPPHGARIGPGGWHWQPRLPPHPALVLSDSGVGDPWRLCDDAACVDVTDIVPARGQTLVIEPCRAPGVPLTRFPPAPLRREVR